MNDMLKFSQMPYDRPDVEAVMLQMNELCAKMQDAKTYEEAKELFLAFDELSAEFNTPCTLAYVRHQLDTTDEFYDKEVEFIDEESPRLQEYSQRWAQILVDSPWRKQLEEEFGSLLFVNTELELKSFSPEIIEDLQEENKLCTEYDKLLASAQIS